MDVILLSILQDEPTFPYRCWFINDEDLLTEWMEGAGPRFIDYPYYAQVVNPKIMERVVESLLRLRYNLIIPASFVDIGNPPEKQLVDISAKRGVFLSMHHIEPMGVSGFTFFNYWKARGKDYKSHHYAILNVSNVREFALGLKASSDMLYNFHDFNPDRFLEEWCIARFGKAATEAEAAYRQFFDSYLFDRRVGTIPFTEFAKKVSIQKESLEKAGELAEQARNKLDGQSLNLLETNLIAHKQILLGITTWLDALVRATDALDSGDLSAGLTSLEEAVKAFELIHAGKALGSRGEKWQHWYRGDTKMNLGSVEKSTLELLEIAKSVEKGRLKDNVVIPGGVK